MRLYRFAVHPEEDGYFFLECINDPRLFTQARSMDETLHMARDVVQCMYGYKRVLIELVVPPDVVTSYERRKHARWAKRARTAAQPRTKSKIRRTKSAA
jgi:hypothetical protein